MKLQTTHENFKNRTLILVKAGKTTFDENGVCEVKDEDAPVVINAYPHISKYNGKSTNKETPAETKTENKDITNNDANKSLDDKKEKSDEEKQKELIEAYKEKIMNATLKELKTLAEEFPKEEWEEYKNKEQFKSYLVGKLE